MTSSQATDRDYQELLAVLAPWMMHQRWFANRGTMPQLEQVATWDLDVEESGIRVTTHLLLDHTAGKPALYQVPLVWRAEPLAHADALVGRVGSDWVYDGPHDPAYTSQLLAVIASGTRAEGDRMWAEGTCTTGQIGKGLESRVLTGEQSNTSIIFEHEGETPVICKVFRTLHDGDNPDVVLQTTLAAAGSTAVPTPVGYIVAQWDDSGETSGRATGHLAFAQEFLPGVEDAWRVALSAAANGADFSAEARSLGVATARVHHTLAAAMPTSEMDRYAIEAVLRSMHARLDAAIDEAPELERFADDIRVVFARAAQAHWPAQQRIHGDFHLGQVLSVPEHGWMLVDFEGEPLRPMRERSALDSPLRDVAGMLRSFDYVSGSLDMGGSAAPENWSSDARGAFEEGYTEASGRDLRSDSALVDAFELDKALYEVVYEARNRPAWLAIPVGAIERLSQRH